jgi:tetratricopeptide (TPR) repeat protein
LPFPDLREPLLIRAWELFDVVAADPRRGEPLATAAVAEARAARDPELLGLSLRALASAHRARWDLVGARRLLAEAVRVSRRPELAYVHALTLVSRAALLQEEGRISAARRDLDLALATMAENEAATGAAGTGDSSAERLRFIAYAGLQRAAIDHNSGLVTSAVRQYRALVDHPGLAGVVAVKVKNNLAIALAQRGAFASARRYSDDAVALATQLGPGVLAPAIQTHAWILIQAGRLLEGVAEFEVAARSYAEAALPLGEYYADYADAMTDLRLLPEAAVAAVKSIEEFEAAGVPLMRADAEIKFARIALLSGDYLSAESAALAAGETLRRQRRLAWRDRAVVLAVESRLLAGTVSNGEFAASRRAAGQLEKAGDLPSAIEANLVAGRVAIQTGRVAKSLAPLQRAATLARTGPVLVRIRGRVAGALAARSRGDDRGVLTECRAGLRDLAAHRSGLPTMELRALASGHGAELGEIGLGAVTRQGTPGRVLHWMERTRAAALMAIDPAPTEGFSQLREAHRQAAETGELAVQTESRPQPARSVASRMMVDAEPAAPQDHELRIRAATWMTPETGMVSTAMPSMTELRALLDGRILVEFGRLEGRVVAVVVGPSRARLVELVDECAVTEHVRALFFALRRLANPRSGAAAAAARASADLRVARLRDLLLRPLGLDAAAELVVVPVGPLHGVPWSALHEGPIAVAPSATFWARTRRAALERPFTAAGTDESVTVLIAGPELAGAHEEIEALRDVHPDARVLGPTESRSEDVIDALRTAELGHLACHGWLRADNPMFSALVLADGPVTVQELHSAGVAPHRLVLASCHSGADVAYAGDEVIGFVSAVLAQGTAGVVASIAAIPDVAAVDLMVELHREIRHGRTLARALHAARARIDRGTPEGYVNWCTFSAHGAA